VTSLVDLGGAEMTVGVHMGTTGDVGEGRQASRVAGQLPAEVASFVGRRVELAEVKRLLSTARLVTLTGVGGAGKTRLAIQVGSGLRRAYPDGVWHVELGTLSDGDLVAYAVVEALRLRDATELSAAGLLAAHLAGRELMLILDNCEHLLDACARLAVTLLRTCPGLRVLCTSRQPLGVIGETVFTVLPLEVPTNGATVTSAGHPYPALRLFVERATAVLPGFVLGSHNEPLVTEICARLDGLPLAIELAAARLRGLTVEQLAGALADGSGALTVRRYAVPAHHRGLSDTFGWSYGLCSPAERTLWARLAVFRGSFDLDAAVAVCASDDLPGGAMLDVISDLVDKSIVVREEPAGLSRYRLLETVREYGWSRLPATGDDPAVLLRRHRDWYLRLAERFDVEWFGPDQERWAGRLRAEEANLRTALGWCLTTPGETEVGLRLVTALQWFWLGCGALVEGRYWLDRALAADVRPTPVRARARSVRTRILIVQANYAAAAADAEETLALARTLDDPLVLAIASYDAGSSVMRRGGDPDRAQALLEDALARFAAIGTNPADHAMTLTALAFTALHRGDPHRAELLCAESRELSLRRGDRWWLAFTLLASAEVAFCRDAAAEGEHYAREVLRLLHALGVSYGIVAALDELAYAATVSGDLERAARLLGAASAVAKTTGQLHMIRWRYWRRLESQQDSIPSALGESAFDAAFERGRRMGQDDAIRYALRANRATRETTTPPGSSPASFTSGLTRREREVADLIAQGLSNHQIATRLVIAQRTAESHVENILRKLSCTSRIQVATWVTEQHTEPG
jgi:predicted ATPase/DNA-binding CsgD family transcriptional regulator